MSSGAACKQKLQGEEAGVLLRRMNYRGENTDELRKNDPNLFITRIGSFLTFEVMDD